MRSRWITAVLAFVFPCVAMACLWDEDTLEMERQQYPEVHELIVGHFVRHSDAYYQWRIGDRTTKSVDQRTPEDYNDIAVAYDKLGEHDKAIETIREKMERWPDENVYESQANLGTFLIHSGNFDEGLVHIAKAIEINPDAHFGREIYQQLLVEYVIERRAAGAKLPLMHETEEVHGGEAGPRVSGFAAFVKQRRGDDAEDGVDAEYARALKGVLGMVRFGNHDSPILMEAVGDLISATEPANLLAARAYYRASYETDDSLARSRYRVKAENAVASQQLHPNHRKDELIEAALKDELAQAEAFASQIATDEANWIARGEKVDERFREKYYGSHQLNIQRSEGVADAVIAQSQPTMHVYGDFESQTPPSVRPEVRRDLGMLLLAGMILLVGGTVFFGVVFGRKPHRP